MFMSLWFIRMDGKPNSPQSAIRNQMDTGKVKMFICLSVYLAFRYWDQIQIIKCTLKQSPLRNACAKAEGGLRGMIRVDDLSQRDSFPKESFGSALILDIW